MGLARQIKRLTKRKNAAAAKKRRRKAFIEPLEPRLLLDAETLSYAAGAGSAVDLTLRLDDVTEELQLIDNVNQSLLQSQALADTIGVEIIGSDQDDTLRLDLDFDALFDSILMSFDGGLGWDTLIGPSVDSTWHITGEDSGTIGSVDFNDVENLSGAAENEDTFIFEAGGSLSGAIEGGAGGFDSLILQGGPYDTVIFKPTGADSGSIHQDSEIIAYSGLEPILSPIPADNIVFDLTEEDDQAIIEAASGSMMQIMSASSIPTFETTSFSIPSISLTINGDDGDDSVTVANDLIMPGADLTINAETITVDPGVTMSTRQIDASGDPLIDSSTGDSGDITFTGETITVGSGSNLLAHDDRGIPLAIADQSSPTIKWTPDQSYPGVEQAGTSGGGSGMRVDIDVDGDREPTLALADPGSGYVINEMVTFNDPDGNGSPITVRVSELNGGDIILEAKATVSARPLTPVDPLFVTDNAETKIDLLGATLKGRTVEVTATADTSKTTSEDDDPFTTSLADAGLLNFSEFLGWSFSRATAEVKIGSNTTIVADSDAIIKAEADSESIIKTLGLALGVTYAESEGISKAYVESGASITAGDNVTIESTTTNTVEATSWAVKGKIQFALTDATSNADAYIENGATINADSLNVTADITNAIETTVEPMELTGESSGFAVAISLLTSTANAYVDSGISIPGDIKITATTTTENRTTASAEPKSTVSGFVDSIKKIYTYLNQKNKQPDEKTQASDDKPEKFELSAAVAIAEGSNTTKAYIGSNAEIRSGGSVFVTSKIEDDFRLLATSEAEEAKVGISAAVAVGTTTNKAKAYIDDGAEVSAANLMEIKASTTIPNPADFSSVLPADFWEGLQLAFSAEDIVQEVTTSYVRSAAVGDDDTVKFALAGSVNILTFDNTAEAYIGVGAKINQDTTTYVPSEEQTVRVDASNTIATVNLVGVFSFTLDPVSLIEDPTGIYDFMGSAGKASLGGSYNQLNYRTTTKAVIKDGADVDAEKEVIVEATSDQFDFLMSVAGGEAEKFGISGAVSYANQDSLTLAQIQSGAVITGGALSVTARDDTRHINVTGGVLLSENLGVGASVGINEIDRETYAVIGSLPTAIGGPWEFTFNQNGDQEQITALEEQNFNGTVESATITDGQLGAGEIQSISHDATQGELTFTFEDETTATPLAVDASAEEVEAALNGLTTIGDAGGVNVTGGAGEPWEIRFNQVGNRDQITAAGAGDFDGTGPPEAATVREGADDLYEQQLLSSTDGTEGTLAFNYEGDSSAPVAHDASAAEVERVLNDLDSIQNAGGVTVSGDDGGPWTIDFNDPGDWGQITAEGVEAFNGSLDPSTTREGDATTQEVQRINHTGTEGAFRLSFGGQTTRPIAYDASAAEVESALNEIVPGGIKVTAAPGGDPGSDTVKVSGDVLLDATSDGNFYVFSLAASVRTKGDEGGESEEPANGETPDGADVEDPLDGETLPALFGDAEGAPTEDDEGNPGEPSVGQGKTGIGIAGDVSINTITDSAMAYINDRGKLTANSITLSSLNETDLIAAAGAAAMSTGGSDKTSLGIAGSFSKNVLSGKTKSYIVGATITETHALTLTAERTGDIFALTAGGSLVPDEKGIAIAGSVSLNKIENETETFLDRVQAVAVKSTDPSSQNIGNILLSSLDTSEMLVIAGSLSYGGKAGIGASVALNKNYNTTKATIRDSIIEHDGGLILEAINDNEIQSGAAGIAASKDTLGASGAVSLNFIDNEVEASVSGSSNRNSTDNGSISLLAKDDSLIESLAGAVGASKKIGFGGALAYNSIENTITAYIDDSELETSGSLSVQALSLGKIKTISAGAAGAEKFTLAGAVSLNFIESTIDAHISSSLDIDATDSISVLATDSAAISALSGSVAGAGKVAIGASVGYNDIANTTTASIVSSDVNSSGGNIVVGASESADVTAIAAGGAGAGKVAIGGSVTINDIGNTTKAYIGGNATVVADGSVVVAAHDDLGMILVAGVLGGAGTAAIGVSNTTVVTDNTVESYIGDAQVTARGKQDTVDVAAAEKDDNGNRTTEGLTGLAVTATSWEDIQSFAVAGEGAGKAAIAGSATVNVLTETTTAYIGQDATINGDNADAGVTQDVSVVAYDDTEILSVAGALSGAGTAAIGAGADVGVIEKETQAYVWANTVNARRNVKVQANSTEDILSISASLGGAGTAGIAGSAGVYVMDNKTRAFIGDDPTDTVDLTGATTTVMAGGSVLVFAMDDSELDIIAGNIAGAGTAGVGVSAAVTVIDKTTEAFLGPNADVTGMGGGSGVTAYTGKFTTGFVPDSGSDDFAALPAAEISQVDDGNDTITFTAPHDFATGEAVIYSKGSSDINIEGGEKLEDGETYYVIAGDTDATLGPSEIKLAANEQDAYDGSAINLADSTISGTHSLTDGIPSAPNGEVTAPGQQLDTTANTNFDNKGGNDLNPDTDTQTKQRMSVADPKTVKGVAVTAINKDDIETIGVSGGGAGTVAVNIGGSVNILSSNTSAFVASGAKVNKGTDTDADPTSDQSVLVAAGNDLYHMGIGGAISIAGTAAVTPGAEVTVITNNTKAYVDDGALVKAEKDIEVTANASEDILSVAAGVGGSGTVGIGVAASVLVMDNTTYAYIGKDATSLGDPIDTDPSGAMGAVAKAGGNILVSAKDTTETFMIAGSLGLGFGAAGIGGAAGVTVLDKDTQAFVGRYATVDAKGNGGYLADLILDGTNTSSGFGTEAEFRGLAVQAHSKEDLFVIGASAGGGLYAGLAGGVTVEIIDSDTQAYIGEYADINKETTNENEEDQSVNVSAANDFSVFALGGGLGIGAAGIAGGIDVGILRNSTTAYIGENAEVYAHHDVDVNALSREEIDSFGISVGAGLAGISGSVSVWSIGSGFSSTYGYTEKDSDGNDGATQSETPLNESDLTSVLSSESDKQSGKEGDPGGGFYSNLVSYNATDQNGPEDDTPDNTQLLGTSTSRAGNRVDSGTSESLIGDSMAGPNLAGTSAYVGTGATVIAEDDINIRAIDHLEFDVIVGSAALGGLGLGGSVAVLRPGYRRRYPCPCRFCGGSLRPGHRRTDQCRSLAGGSGDRHQR
ncbi:MAG: LEPR-XLL domain-containing protein [Deltaproteobacteria bacterium]